MRVTVIAEGIVLNGKAVPIGATFQVNGQLPSQWAKLVQAEKKLPRKAVANKVDDK